MTENITTVESPEENAAEGSTPDISEEAGENQMTEEEIDEAVATGAMPADEAIQLKKEYGYEKEGEEVETKEREKNLSTQIKGQGNLNEALRQSREKTHKIEFEVSNLKQQIVQGQNAVRTATEALEDLEASIDEDTPYRDVKDKLSKLSKRQREAISTLAISEREMMDKQVELLILDDNYPAQDEIWKLADELCKQNEGYKKEVAASGNRAQTLYTIGMRHPKADGVISKFRKSTTLKDKVAKNLEILKKRKGSPGSPAGGSGRPASSVKIQELEKKVKEHPNEETILDLIEAKRKDKKLRGG